jgi:hypothetical protein
MPAVALDPAEFKQFKPQFADVADATLALYFSLACGIVDNTDASPFPYAPDRNVEVRRFILYALLCHLLTMDRNTRNSGGASGPMTAASEGSVSVSFAAPPLSDNAYYSETPCGRAFLAMIRPYALGGRIVFTKKRGGGYR